MSSMREYAKKITEQIEKIANTQEEAINATARAIVDAHSADKGVYAFGPGVHSFMGVEELFYRSGGLSFVRPIGAEMFTLFNSALLATAMERTPGVTPPILKHYGVGKGDVLIINNAYGINSACIDAALYAKENGAISIAVTSVDHSRSLPADHPARHPSKKNLCDICDIAVDTFVPVGDGVVYADNKGEKLQVGPCSTIGMAMAMNGIVCAVVDEMIARGMDPEIWRSGNSPGGDEYNKRHVQRYGESIRHLK